MAYPNTVLTEDVPLELQFDVQGQPQPKFRSQSSSIRKTNFELLEKWTQKKKAMNMLHNSMNHRGYKNITHKEFGLDGVAAKESRSQILAKRLMSHPSSLHCVIWDSIGIAMIAYDVVVVPMSFFDMQQTSRTYLMEWATRVFWTLSIPVGFVVGYIQKDGEAELHPIKVMRHYVRGWFSFDIVVVACDWSVLLAEGLNLISAVRISKIVRLLRLMRLMRAARIIKMPLAVEQLIERFYSEQVYLVVGIGKLTMLFIALVHLVACGFYSVTGLFDDAAESWSDFVPNRRTSDLYAMAFHSAVAAVGGAGQYGIDCVSIYERVYMNVVLIGSFVISAAFVSMITARLTRMEMYAQKHDEDFAVLRHYLNRQCDLPVALVMRAMRSARHALSMLEKNTAEKDIRLLQIISEPLRMEIHYNMYMPVLCSHPFFAQLQTIAPQAVRRICHASTEVLMLTAGDTLFTVGEIPKKERMCFLIRGAMTYTDAEGDVFEIEKGRWFCEGCLWTLWVHLGDMIALNDCTILALDSDAFFQIAASFPSFLELAVVYGVDYVSTLNLEDDDGLSDVCEIAVSGFEVPPARRSSKLTTQ